MATTTHFHDYEADMPVRSRVSWGPILAGAAVAFAVYFLLSLLGAAIGLSVSDDVQRDNLGVGAGIWAILTVIIAFFVGGWVTSRCTVGEDRVEAILYGAIVWGVVFFFLLWLGSETSMGLSAMVTANSNGGAAGGDVENARSALTEAAWWAFAGTALSMLAAIGGSLVGSMSTHDRHLHHTAHQGTATTAGTTRPTM